MAHAVSYRRRPSCLCNCVAEIPGVCVSGALEGREHRGGRGPDRQREPADLRRARSEVACFDAAGKLAWLELLAGEGRILLAVNGVVIHADETHP